MPFAKTWKEEAGKFGITANDNVVYSVYTRFIQDIEAKR